MNLYTLLKDRASINILKILYENETKNKSYTMTYPEMKDKLTTTHSPFTLPNLKAASLISIEKSDGNHVLAITKKGKAFIDQFDKLIDIFINKPEKIRAFKVDYNLKDLEQRILVIASKMQGELGSGVDINDLTQEVYPFDDVKKKKAVVSRFLNRLVELNLISIEEKDDARLISLTPTGTKAIKEQFMEVKI